MTVLAHVSDTHGNLFPIPNEAECIIHSGDWMPNLPKNQRNSFYNLNRRSVEIDFQKNWIETNIENIKNWIADKLFIYVAGNHDYFSNPCDILKENEINAIDITNKYYVWNNIRMYGFPYINYINGNWNYERSFPEMKEEVQNLKPIFDRGLDILICHAPLYGVLDTNIDREHGEHCGNAPLMNCLSYEIEEEKLPKWICCGHLHESRGLDEVLNIKISNAATTVHLITLD